MANDIVKTLQVFVLELQAKVKALKEEIDILASGGFKPAGSVYFADLPSLINERYGFVYNIKDDFITTSDFIEGAGKRYSAGTNVGIVKDDNNNLKYDTLASFVDTAAIYEAIGVKQNINLSEVIAGASTVEGALKAINQSAGITVDTEISSTSTNPVQNKVIKGQLDLKLDADGKANSATSADYATKAERDGHNNVISSTYATKTELSDGLSGKVNAVAGKGLSSNDYTNEDKDYVDGLPAQLLGKQDKYETITYAQWQAMTPAQKVEKDYYISNYPASALTAGNIAYDNTTSGMAADDTQEAIDELKGGLTSRIINITTTGLFQIINQGSHFITDGVLHIFAKIKCVALPAEGVNDFDYVILPSSMEITTNQRGIVINIAKASGEWVTPSNLVYGYISTNSISGHTSDLTVGSYYLIDMIAKITTN